MDNSAAVILPRGTPRSDLDIWCRANWDRAPAEQRAACVAHLRRFFPPEVRRLIKQQHAQGERIGSHDPCFHFGGGMAVRNALREVLRDEDLPPVVGPAGGYPEGQVVRNWDDFYMGALEELAETEEL